MEDVDFWLCAIVARDINEFGAGRGIECIEHLNSAFNGNFEMTEIREIIAWLLLNVIVDFKMIMLAEAI